MTSYKRVGEKIRKIRKQKGLTQEQLAELAKIEPRSIVDIEGGKRNPTLKTLNKIVKALETKLAELIS